MDRIRIFISYTHDDMKIAAELESLFNGALGPAVHVFRDETSIGYGADIRAAILEELEAADVLVVLVAGGQPVSALNWVGWEVGTFQAAWRMKRRLHPGVESLDKSIVGRVVILSNEEVSMGPQLGKKAVKLGIPTDVFYELISEEERNRFRGQARAQTELHDLVQTMQTLVEDGVHGGWFQNRQKGLDLLVTNSKEQIYKALKGRVRRVYKPTKQLVIRFGAPTSQRPDRELPDEARLIFSGQASGVFGWQQDDPRLFKKVEEPPIGVERFEMTWSKFRSALKDHRYGAYWRDVIEQAAIGAKKGGAALDANLVLVADNEQRHRVVATTVTTFLNNDCEVSLYLIEALQRRDRGEEVTSNLLNGLIIVCRFRFAFLEFKSEFYYRNFQTNFGTIQAKAKELVMELDYLRSEAIHASLEKPGAWQEYMDEPRLTAMMSIWHDIDLEIRATCERLLSTPADESNNASALKASVDAIVDQLKKINDQVRPYNNELGEAIAKKMSIVFGRDKI